MSAQQIRHKYTSPPAPNAGSTDVNQIAERNGLLLQPHPIKAKFKRQKSNKYCHFHHDQSHVTNDYFHLKASIEKLIHKCHLSECIDKHGSLRHANLSARENDNHKIWGQIIDGGQKRDWIYDNFSTVWIMGEILGGLGGVDTLSVQQARVWESREAYLMWLVLHFDKSRWIYIFIYAKFLHINFFSYFPSK